MDFSMGDWLAGAAMLGSAVSAWMSRAVRVTVLEARLEVQQLRTNIAEYRAADKDELRTWINGSFMRAGETKVRIEAIEAALSSHLEHPRGA